MDPKPASDSRSQLVRWMGVLDANTAGNVHGGTVMKLCAWNAPRCCRGRSPPGGARDHAPPRLTHRHRPHLRRARRPRDETRDQHTGGRRLRFWFVRLAEGCVLLLPSGRRQLGPGKASRSASSVDQNASSAHGISLGANDRTSTASGVVLGWPMARARYTINTTRSSARE